MQRKTFYLTTIFVFILFSLASARTRRARDYNINIGHYPTGKLNSITDVPGVAVGHVTLIKGDDMRTGVTAIIPHQDNIFQYKVPAAIHIANGFGKLAGWSQVEELGNIETPIILTNTLSVPAAADALIDYTLSATGNNNVRSVNPIVGETNDSRLNNIQARYVHNEHILQAIKNAHTGIVEEGNAGAGTGTICFGYKGGIGTASRVLPESSSGYTIGVLVQTNFGGDLTVAGVPVGLELEKQAYNGSGDGSCMIVVATNAPIKSRNLKRLAKRALFGFARTGASGSNGSGDYVIAFSVAKELRMSYVQDDTFFDESTELRNDRMSPLFKAVAEATEEAIINSLFAAETMKGMDGTVIKSLPIDKTIEILKSHNVIE